VDVRSPDVTAGGPLILVVEDDASLRLLCRFNLELDGFRVVEAATLDAARDAVGAERPALVVLDLRLGTGESGELLDELRATAIPVVLLSGVADLESYRERADDVLAKPFAPADLSAVARRLANG
jgi:two-component system KDP operon response regulator KdpE